MFGWFRSSRSSAAAAASVARSTSPISSALSGVAERLLTLEVNTIVKAGMSAQKMPEVPLALHLVARAYVSYVNRVQAVYPRADGTVDLVAWQQDTGTNGAADFRMLSETVAALQRGLPVGQADEDGERSAILFRIRTNSRQIAAGLDTLQATAAKANENFADFFGRTFNEVSEAIIDTVRIQPTIPTDFALLVRKAWDMGTETVVMQTSLQIDGDVVTRMSPMVLGKENGQPVYDEAGRIFIRGIHHEALGSATGQWQSLFQLVGTLIGGLADRVFPRK